MADKRTKRQAYPAVTPASFYTPRHSDRRPTFATPCHSDRSPDIVGTKRRNLFQRLFSFPASLYRPIYHAITACIMQNKPNFQNRKTNATYYAGKTYRNTQLRLAPKKQTQSNPILHRFTLHEIRYATSHIRYTPAPMRKEEH
jgi:hypothetical protein